MVLLRRYEGKSTHSKVSLQLMPPRLVILRDMFVGENWGRPCAFRAYAEKPEGVRLCEGGRMGMGAVEDADEAATDMMNGAVTKVGGRCASRGVYDKFGYESPLGT